jgi:hypothetical protein
VNSLDPGVFVSSPWIRFCERFALSIAILSSFDVDVFGVSWFVSSTASCDGRPGVFVELIPNPIEHLSPEWMAFFREGL